MKAQNAFLNIKKMLGNYYPTRYRYATSSSPDEVTMIITEAERRRRRRRRAEPRRRRKLEKILTYFPTFLKVSFFKTSVPYTASNAFNIARMDKHFAKAKSEQKC